MQKCKQLCTFFNFCTHTFFYKDSYSVSPSAKYCPSIRPSTIKTMCMDINKEITTTKVKVQKKLFKQICILSIWYYLVFWGWTSHTFLEQLFLPIMIAFETTFSESISPFKLVNPFCPPNCIAKMPIIWVVDMWWCPTYEFCLKKQYTLNKIVKIKYPKSIKCV